MSEELDKFKQLRNPHAKELEREYDILVDRCIALINHEMFKLASKKNITEIDVNEEQFDIAYHPDNGYLENVQKLKFRKRIKKTVMVGASNHDNGEDTLHEVIEGGNIEFPDLIKLYEQIAEYCEKKINE